MVAHPVDETSRAPLPRRSATGAARLGFPFALSPRSQENPASSAIGKPPMLRLLLPSVAVLVLLVACVSEPPAPAPSPKPKPIPRPLQAPAEEPLPANLRELVGSLRNVPADGEVELALLVIDERDRPQRLLGSLTLRGTGADLPFRLRFNPEVFPPAARVELRGRVSQAGQLTRHLPAQRIAAPQTQTLGPLQMVAAP